MKELINSQSKKEIENFVRAKLKIITKETIFQKALRTFLLIRGQSTVTYQVDSSFCVIIPETVDAFNGFQLTASNMNITESEQVNVSVNGENSIPMTNDEGDTFNLRLNVNDSDHVAEFVKNQTTSEFIVTGQPVDGEMPAAGYYTGTVEFVVELGVKPPQY